MYQKTDLTTARQKRPFSWVVGSVYTGMLDITKTPIKEFNLNPEVGIEMYRQRHLIQEYFGPDVNLPPIATPPVSYGHINTLGAELIFPEDGEVNHGTLCHSLKEGIEILKKPVDFASAGMMPFYVDYQKQMRAAFPDETVGLGMGWEGPMTTAYTLRRDEFFYDAFDNPKLFQEFMKLLTASIVDYIHFRRELDGLPPVNTDGGYMCDDISSMIHPDRWPELVLPYLTQYYNGQTTAQIGAHIEGLTKDHLPYLDTLGLNYYDPSISPKLTPKLLRDNCHVPFGWRLGSFHYRELSCDDVQDWVFQAAADGACKVFTYVASGMISEETRDKVHRFIETGREVEKMLADGAELPDLAVCVSEAGKKRFWDHWPE